jgi:hypothetical protein
MSGVEELISNFSDLNIKSDLEKINNRIASEVCFKTIDKISDSNLIEDYKKSKSVINEIDKLEKILEKNNINDEIRKNIINEYILDLIPPGTKGSIRGNKFNQIVMEYIKSLDFLNNANFIIQFEKNHEVYKTSEIPDWYIHNKNTNQIIIGMNQMDLWSGGHQTNRGSKYILDKKDENENVKLLCVICNDVKIKSDKNKIYKLFKKGFDDNTLCYITNLENIIKVFFNL